MEFSGVHIETAFVFIIKILIDCIGFINTYTLT